MQASPAIARAARLIGAALLVSTLAPLPGSAAEGLASPLTLEGARSVSIDEINGYLGSKGIDPTDARSIDDAIGRLMATGIFSDVRIAARRGGAHITVVENPVITTISFDGASAAEKKQLEDATKLKKGGRYTAARAQADVVALREVYRRLGRLQTTIESKVSQLPDERVTVAFVISEGVVNKVERIGFTGNKAFSERQLRDVILTSESGWLDVFKSTAFYDPERIDADRELLRRYYQNNGYPDAQIVDVATTLNEAKTAWTLIFNVDEGEATSFGKSSVESDVAGLDTGGFLGAAATIDGKGYSQERIEKSVEVLTEKLAQSGQPFALVRPKVTHDRAHGRSNVVFRIEQGQARYVERIEIAGNTRTKDHVIRRELKLGEGDPVNAYLIEQSVRRLKKLGFFKTVDAKPLPGSAADRVRLVITVVEEDTGTLSFGGGYSTTEGVVGDISWTERNLLGNGQYLRLKLAGSASRFQADIGFTEPRFLDSNVAAGFDLFYKDVDFTRQSSYKSTKAGGDVRIGVPVTERTSIGFNYTFIRNTLYDVGPDASLAIKEALPPGATTTSYNTSSVGSSITYDGRDSKKRPTEGVTYTLAQDLAGVGGDVRFVRSTGDFKAYYPVAESVTFMGRVTGGNIQGWGGQDVKLLDLFYKGGETVRGFASSGIGPRDTLSANKDALGGTTYIATTAETLFDIPGVPRDLGVRGAAFVDAGSLWGTNKTASALPGVAGTKPQLRASAGVGVVWDSPIGGLRADYAVPLVSQSYDKLQPFSFGMVGY